MRRRAAVTEQMSAAAERFTERLVYEDDLQHNAYIPGVGALTGRLTGSPGRSIYKRLSLLVDRHIHLSLQCVCKDSAIYLDCEGTAPGTLPTAVVMDRLGETETIPLSWSRNRLVVGQTAVSFNTSTAGEDLVEALCRPVAQYFVAG